LESVGTRNFILRQNPYTYKYNPTSNRISKKNTVPNLCQSDRHFLAFSDTTRNERHRKYN